MNPSASGWIPKVCAQLGSWEDPVFEVSEDTFYFELRSVGFLYGVSSEIVANKIQTKLQLTRQEYTKVNLLCALLYVFHKKQPTADIKQALTSIRNYYQHLHSHNTNVISRLTVTKKDSATLERILSDRLQEHNFLLRNKSVALLTHAFLFVDVLRYKHYLEDPNQSTLYQNTLERWILAAAISALNSKKKKNKYDLHLLGWVEASSEVSGAEWEQEESPFDVEDIWERMFLFEVCNLAVWDDRSLDPSEYQFLLHAAKKLIISEEHVKTTASDLLEFAKTHASQIQLYEYSHPVKQFYKQANATVKLLILRNKGRLLTELQESGELIRLLRQSTFRDLSEAEKSKVRSQLLDICKTIPSLTIFLLPGGTVLLPILMKFIPQLLPSAFHENRIKD